MEGGGASQTGGRGEGRFFILKASLVKDRAEIPCGYIIFNPLTS